MNNAESSTAATVAPQGAHVTPDAPAPKKRTTRGKKAPKSQKTAKGAKPKPPRKAPKTAKKLGLPRSESKGAKILALLRRPKGATLAEVAKLTGWQNHSIRGFLSGTIGKKMGLTVESAKRQDGVRVYSISK